MVILKRVIIINMTNNYSLGILLKITNLFLFTCLSLWISKSTINIPPVQIFFLIAVGCIILMLPFMVYTKRLNIDKVFSKYYLFRSLFNIAGMVSWIEALNRISANDATAVSYMTPIITSLLAVVFCGERFNYKCAFAILIGFVGAYIVIVPDSYNMVSQGGMIAFISSCMWACHDIVCRKQTVSQDKYSQTFITFLYTTVISFPFALSSWQPFDSFDLMVAIVGSIISIANVTVLFLAYKYAPINILMPFSFLRLVMMTVANFILFGETIKSRTLLGASIIIVAALFVVFSMNRQEKVKQV